MIQITTSILVSIVVLLTANYSFRKLSGHVFADQAIGRRSALVWAMTLLVGLIALLFVNVTTLVMMLLLVQQTTFAELADGLKATIFLVSYLGAAFAAAHGLRRSLGKRIPAIRMHE